MMMIAACTMKTRPHKSRTFGGDALTPDMHQPTEEQWRIAGRKNNKKRPGRSPAGASGNGSGLACGITPGSNEEPFTEQDVGRVVEKVEAARAEVKASRMFSEFVSPLENSQRYWQCLKSIEMVVCFGLGSLSSHHARYQLGFLLELVRKVGGSYRGLEAYDPVFSGLDRAVLRHYSFTNLTENECGARVANCSTLFYMPHCEAFLNESLVCANLKNQTLENVVLIGNGFSKYARLFEPGMRPPSYSKPDNILALLAQGSVVEVPLNESDLESTGAFNDTSIHFFKSV